MAEDWNDAQPEQSVYDAWQRWSEAELPRRRDSADRARKRALQTNDEVLWKHAEQIERGFGQLSDMIEHQDPYFARIRGSLEEESGERFQVDLRVHRYHRSETFPLPDHEEMLDISHLAPLADLVRNPAQATLSLGLADRRFLGVAGGSPKIRVLECNVEDIELDGQRVVRTAPRYGAIFEDRVQQRLRQSALPALDILADVLDREQNLMINDRDPRRRVIILDGPAGTGKTVVAAHRIAVSEDPQSPGIYVTPTATLRDYVRPALPRLGMDASRARVYSVSDLAMVLWPDGDWEGNFSGVVPDSSHSPETWAEAFETHQDVGGEIKGYRRARQSLDGTSADARLGLGDVGPLLWLAAWLGKSLPFPQPGWIIVDEAQSIPRLAYQALARWLGTRAHWVLAGDLMQRGESSQIGTWKDVERALGLGSSEVGYLWLRHNYRVPVNIHEAAERLRKVVMPGAEDSSSVPWHPHLGGVKVDWGVDRDRMASLARAQVEDWRRQGLSAIALMVPGMDQLEIWDRTLGLPLQRLNGRDPYRGGAVLTTLEVVRGLEFDAVMLLDVSNAAYPHREVSARNLYTAITRARRFIYVLAPSASPSPWIAVMTADKG